MQMPQSHAVTQSSALSTQHSALSTQHFFLVLSACFMPNAKFKDLTPKNAQDKVDLYEEMDIIESKTQQTRKGEGGKMTKQYTAIVRKSRLAYVAVCLELNVAAQGTDLADVEKNLRDAIETYCDEIKQNPETIVSSMSTEDLIEFLQDTEPEWYVKPSENFILKPLEIHEVPSYA
jgi:predicted RNase H-like HicB family nuclease